MRGAWNFDETRERGKLIRKIVSTSAQLPDYKRERSM